MSKADSLLKSISKFYEDSSNGQILLDILHHKKGISLRSLEYFVTNFAKQTNLSYTTNGRLFTVHVAYKSSLDGYSKKLFDPFCRTERITFSVNGQEIVTTVAQLNFIRWCITNDIILQLGSKSKKDPKTVDNNCIDTNVQNLLSA